MQLVVLKNLPRFVSRQLIRLGVTQFVSYELYYSTETPGRILTIVAFVCIICVTWLSLKT